jgi:hypothetical protein
MECLNTILETTRIDYLYLKHVAYRIIEFSF